MLKAPGANQKAQGLGGGATSTQNVVLRVRDADAPQLAFSSDNGKVWLVLRPQAGAQQSKPTLVNLERLLLGLDPLPLDGSLTKKQGGL